MTKVDLVNDKRIYLFGIGKEQRDFEYYFEFINVEGYYDNDETGENVYPITAYKSSTDSLLIVCKAEYERNKIELISYGYSEWRDFIWIYDFINLIYEESDIRKKMLKKVIEAEPHWSFRCETPFLHSQIDCEGNVYTCCTAYMGIPIGNMFESDFEKIWKSDIARIIRLSILNKTFCFCNLKNCSNIDLREESRTEEFAGEYKYEYKIESYPQMLNISIDDTCNLNCKFCKLNKKKDTIIFEERKWLAEKIIDIMPNIEKIYLAGIGEVFFSPIYRLLLNKKRATKGVEINIVTNLMLFQEKDIELLQLNYNKINIYVSIDAATKETYEKIRIGANYEKLLINLEKLKRAREEGKIGRLVLRFLVQIENYKEMHEFIKLAIYYKADQVDFMHMIDCGVYSREEYYEKSMLDTNGMLRGEFQEYFNNKEFRKRFVNMDYAFFPEGIL